MNSVKQPMPVNAYINRYEDKGELRAGVSLHWNPEDASSCTRCKTCCASTIRRRRNSKKPDVSICTWNILAADLPAFLFGLSEKGPAMKADELPVHRTRKSYVIEVFKRIITLDMVVSTCLDDRELYPRPWRVIDCGPVIVAWKLLT